MSTKPAIGETRFAVDGTDVDATNVAAPTGTQRNVGWSLNEVPTSAVANYLQNRAYRWFLYLSEGELTGDHTIAGTLEVTGAVTADSTLLVVGAATVGGANLTFVDFTFTADASTEKLTHTAHGLETGDGPVRVSNSGGALPTGLVAATDYYVIKFDANNVQLATTRRNAILGVPINITTNGTGTQTLLHQVGTTRVTDATVTRNIVASGAVTAGTKLSVMSDTASTVSLAAPASLVSAYTVTWPLGTPAQTQVVQVDVSGNLVFDNAIPNTLACTDLTVSGTIHFPDVEVYSAMFGVPNTATGVMSPGTSGSSPVINIGISTNANNLPLKCRTGTVISAWLVRLVKNSAIGSLSVKLWKVPTGGGSSPTQIGSTQSNGAASPGTITLGQSGLTEGVQAGTSYFLEVIGGGTTGDLILDYQTTAL